MRIDDGHARTGDPWGGERTWWQPGATAHPRSGPVLPGGDVRGLFGGHRLELDAQGGELEPGDLGVDRLGHDVDLGLELRVVLATYSATAPGSRSSCP